MSVLVHPKNRISDEEKPQVIDKTLFKNCEHIFVGETGRPQGMRVNEHCQGCQPSETRNREILHYENREK